MKQELSSTPPAEPQVIQARDNFLAGSTMAPPPVFPERLLRTGRTGDTVLVSIELPSHGRINDLKTPQGSCLEKLKQELSELQQECNIVLSLSGLAYLASTAVGALEALERRVTSQGKRLEFCGLNRTNLEILKLTWKGGFERQNYADEAAALGALHGQN